MKKYDLETIKAIAEIMKENGLTKLSFKYDDEELLLERACAPAKAIEADAKAADKAVVDAPAPHIDGNPVKSPMVGIFYGASSPEDKPYVQVGDKVKKGDVLCIIEAMKLMNEITSEQDGEIAAVCVEDGSLVEFGQTLFVIK